MPNYSFTEYQQLLSECETFDDIEFMRDLVKEDFKARHLYAHEYIELSALSVLRQSSIAIEQLKRNQGRDK